VSLFLLVFGCNNMQAQDTQYNEYEVKAAYIVNFSKFVTWPDEAFSSESSPFVIGVYKNEQISTYLKKMLLNKRILGRMPIIKNFSKPEDISKCQILFIGKVDKQELNEIYKKVKDQPVLTVGDNISEFCESGGMINFTHQYSKYRFEINNNAATKAKIKISSKLLALAKIVTEDEIKF